MKLDSGRLLAISGLGSGLLGGAPGTWGSLLAVGAWWAAVGLGASGAWLAIGLACGVAAASAVCVVLAPWAIARAGNSDPKFVVADELAGQWTALVVMLPAGSALADGQPARGWIVPVLAFVLFRVFDIAKPWPCRRLERLPAGWGILADDLAAGLYAGLLGSAGVLAIAWALP